MTGAAILAAGASRRMGRTKQLLPFRGTTLLRAVAQEVLASSAARTAIVLGADAAAVAASLDGVPATLLDNPGWQEGIAASIRVAATWANSTGLEALVLCVGDQPAVTAAHVDRLLSAYRAAGTIAASRYANVVGVPAVFPRACFPQLLALRGDEGARRVIGAATVYAIDWPGGAVDLDTPEALARLNDP
jgi:CTP:molybdopterin cytidylyltransferase MocA